MKKKLIIFLMLSSLILTGFTIIEYDYETYDKEEPTWVWRETIDESVYKYTEIKPKVEKAIENINKKGLYMEDIVIHISPKSYGIVKGMASRDNHEIIIADNSYNTIYHELGHTYQYKNKDLLKKYEKDMQRYYPDLEVETPVFSSWYGRINEDFAEEFRVLFTGGKKRTLYPPFPNFYEWLLRNTQPVEITREEVFDKLGGTDKLIKEGIVIGNENGDYMLSKPITRGEVATVLVRLKGLTKEKQVPFTDIKNQWYSGYVRKIYNEGLIKGLPNNTFAGDKLITRYELHMILERL